MPSERMFRRAFPGLDEEEVLDCMDRLLAVIERQNREGNKSLVTRMRSDLAGETVRMRKERQRRMLLLCILPLLFLAGIIVLGLLWGGAAEVTGDSMSPFLKAGDVVIYSRRQEELKRGDLVVCDVEGTRIIKRTAAVPGDLVRVDGDGRVRIEGGDGKPGEDGGGRTPTQIHLKENEYFLLGDNREMSVDSRDERIGPVERERIEGRVMFVIRRVGREPERSGAGT